LARREGELDADLAGSYILHFSYLIDNNQNIGSGGFQRGNRQFFQSVDRNSIFPYPKRTLDIDMGQCSTFAVEDVDGKADPHASFPNLTGDESGHRYAQLLDYLSIRVDFPHPGGPVMRMFLGFMLCPYFMLKGVFRLRSFVSERRLLPNSSWAMRLTAMVVWKKRKSVGLSSCEPKKAHVGFRGRDVVKGECHFSHFTQGVQQMQVNIKNLIDAG
jgi:hypothetical protein